MLAYGIGILGSPSSAELVSLKKTIAKMVEEFELEAGHSLAFLDAAETIARDRHLSFVAAYFGNADHKDASVASDLLDQTIPIVPVVSHGASIDATIPDCLKPLNCVRVSLSDHEMVELSAALLECIGLLRPQRRAFISYRRTESRQAAIQLHDLLGGKGFDVFLDTHDIRPGDRFQDALWHHLCDSDVVLMLDTPGYFSSKWTREELGRARAKEIHVLRIVWPDHAADTRIDLAETIFLDKPELLGADGPIVDPSANSIVQATELLRSKSIASRQRMIVGKLRADVGRIGVNVEGIGAHWAVKLKLSRGKTIYAYPAVGIPTAATLNDIVRKCQQTGSREPPILVYDHVGIRTEWANHIEWLNKNIAAVRAIKVSEVAYDLVGLDVD